ncbi:hypothetical protein quinque_008722 [Culex quinquefasciatus]
MLFFPAKGSGLTAASLLNPMSPTPTDMLHGTCCAAIYFADSGPVTLKHPAAHFASERQPLSNSIVQKYCPIDLNINVRIFWRPTVENILKYRIVVVSLNISMELAWLDLPKGHSKNAQM